MLDPDFSRFRVDDDLALARSLPPEAFTHSAFLDLELATLFRRSWLLVPDPPARRCGTTRGRSRR